MVGNTINIPRIMIGGISGDSGKTLVSCGLLSSFKSRGLKIAAFKKGPDYIDTAWLSLASNVQARNLDSYLFTNAKLIQSFYNNTHSKDIALIEGNRGLYDGFDSKGTHSTAELAKILQVPVILVVNATKITRTLAAIVLGCKMFDKKVKIRGVIINQIAGVRHSNVVKNAIENETGLEVHGLIPKLNDENLFPSRHLGLITPAEYEHARNSIMVAKELIEDNVDISRIIEIAAEAVEIKVKCEKSIHHNKSNVKIGYFFDRVFSFYYPENLEALKLRGAELIPISSIQDEKLPDIDALYIGGGFPETNIELLLSNKGLMSSVKVACEAGMPVYAECGGLIYLSKALEINSNTYQLAGVFPINIKMGDKPRGHGYIEAVVDSRNPFFHLDSTIRGHEFHYTEIVESSSQLNTCFAMRRGIGAWQNRDGLIYKNTFASYSHIHAITSDSWASSMINRALKFRSKHTK